MKPDKQLRRALRQIRTPESASVLPQNVAQQHSAEKPRRRFLTVAISAMLAVILIGCAAVPVMIGKINAGYITDQTEQLTSVPEGYVGIYSAADLLQMRRDIENGVCAEYYILMNDITFTEADFAEGGICEGGWTPIEMNTVRYYHFDDKESIPDGFEYGKAYGTPYIKAVRKNKLKMFNGNGYVIRGLEIRADADEMLAPHAEHSYACRNLYVGLFGDTDTYYAAHIIRLGMEDTRITVAGDMTPYHDTLDSLTLHIGAIAGKAYYVGACYAENTEIEIDLVCGRGEDCERCRAGKAHEPNELAVGSLVGTVTYLDACYAEDYAMNVSCNGELSFYPHIGGLVGRSQTTLTSWHSGTVNIAGDAMDESCRLEEDHFDPWACGDRIPIALSMENFELLREKAIAAYGEDSYKYKLIGAYYILRDPAELKSQRQIEELNMVMKIWSKMISHHTGDYETELDACYLFDFTANYEEVLHAEKYFRAVMGSDEEYRALCEASNVKIGDIYCYEWTDGDKVRSRDLDGFDFESVWVMHDGRPRLRIFSE